MHAVLRRQGELGVPRALEWVDELAPSLTLASTEAGLLVQRCPLLVLDVDALRRRERLTPSPDVHVSRG